MTTADERTLRMGWKQLKHIILNLGQWFLKTVVFSLTPLFFYILLHWMFGLTEDPRRQYISELCTFTLVIASSISVELAKKEYRNTQIRDVVFPAFMVLLIIFFLSYGAIYASFLLNVPQLSSEKVIDKLYQYVKVISLIYFLIALLLQVKGEAHDI
jgi:hypothetical protein